MPAYKGRFAPSPTGPLHAGSLVAALASWLDAQAHGGQWLVRIEDVDVPRCVPDAAQTILAQLAACGLVPDAAPTFQSQRSALYQAALEQLLTAGHAFACGCSRSDIARARQAAGLPRQRHTELVYPGTCRSGLHGRPARAWRLLLPALGTPPVQWHDRQLGPQQQDVGAEVGDFVLRRADGVWAYQLAVVVDDAAQGVTHVVRGVDLADNTPRQIVLQRALGAPMLQYLHTPLVLGDNGEKLSKQHGAAPLNAALPMVALQAAARTLGLPQAQGSLTDALASWVSAWAARICICRESGPRAALVSRAQYRRG